MIPTSQARPLSLARTFLVALVAYALGAGTVLSAYLFSTRTTEVWVAKAQVTAGGIVIPAGTELIHDSFMSEGFDVLRLYVNVEPPHDEQFTRVQEPSGRLIIPYKVDR